MSTVVCLAANPLGYAEGGGHLWVYLNWALGLRALGCRVIWLEAVASGTPIPEVNRLAASLKARLERYGLADSLALCAASGGPPGPRAPRAIPHPGPPPRHGRRPAAEPAVRSPPRGGQPLPQVGADRHRPGPLATLARRREDRHRPVRYLLYDRRDCRPAGGAVPGRGATVAIHAPVRRA